LRDIAPKMIAMSNLAKTVLSGAQTRRTADYEHH